MSIFLVPTNNDTSIYKDYCIWREIIRYNNWLTECGASTSGEEDEGEAFIASHIEYCPVCGKKIKLLPFKRYTKSEEYTGLYNNFQLINKALIACMMFLEEETKKGNNKAKELLDEITKLGTQ